MDATEVLNDGPFRDPAFIVALDGWVNAGSAATIAAQALIAEAEAVARFDADQLYDYRMSRPVVDFIEGVISRVEWPELTIRLKPYEKRDLLVLTGIEPNWNWQSLSRKLAELASHWGVTEHLSIGGVPWAAPHTRPVSIMTTASSPSRIPAGEHPSGLLRVPGAAVSAIEWHIGQVGIPTTGFWARVPNYVGSSYTPAALALLNRLGRHLEITLDLADLQEDAVTENGQLDQIVANRPDIMTVVEQFEQLYDAQADGVSGEDLAAEIERFLRDQ